MEQTIREWLDTLTLDAETGVHAELVLALARMFDEQPLTSTLAELRRTKNDLRRLLDSEKDTYDPLEEILRR